MDELKKCPFCGKNAFEPTNLSPARWSFWEIFCRSCHVRIRRYTKEDVVKAWNTRQSEGK